MSKAAEQGDPDAQANLGFRYLNGLGVEKLLPQAFLWIDLAAKAGSAKGDKWRADLGQQMTVEQFEKLERLFQNTDWKPKSAADSAFDVFMSASRETINGLQQNLGEQRFRNLKTTEHKAPTIGQVILEDTHGIQARTIATNIKTFLSDLNRTLDFKLVEQSPTQEASAAAKTLLGFIRRVDDLADVGTLLGERAADATENLIEYHLALVRELERINSDCLPLLLKRFTLREGLRARGLIRDSGLHLVLLPIPPW
jgi:hypothetical protein